MEEFNRVPGTATPEHRRLLCAIQQAAEVRTHFDFLCWLQGDIQHVLPHEIMLAAWGTPAQGILYVDIASPLPGVRTTPVAQRAIQPLVSELFQRWQSHGGRPYRFDVLTEGPLAVSNADDAVSRAFHGMRSAIVHAIRDERSHYCCLYGAFSSSRLPPSAPDYMALLIPSIDAVLRQLALLPEQGEETADDVDEPEPAPHPASEHLVLSDREAEIMQWVRLGKTNQEIGMILDISAFTVKNHLQRIFRKLDVTNRAQAVARFPTAERSSG